MKTRRACKFIGLSLAVAFVLLACDLSAVTQAGKPVASITSPANGVQVTLGQEVIVQASATDSSGITRIELWVDGALSTMPQTTSPQASFTAALRWTPTTPGAHTLVARATNIGGSVGDSPTITVNAVSAGVPTSIPSGQPADTPPAGCAKPTIYDFSAKPTTIKPGETAGLSWNVADATSVMLIGGDLGKKPVALQGTEVVKPAATTTYTLHIESCAGPYDVPLTITVSSAPSPACAEPFVKFGASKTRITAGESITLEWYVENATSVMLDGGRFAKKQVSLVGTETDTPQLISPGRATSTTYTLIIQSCAEARSAFVVVDAYPAGQAPPPPPPGATRTPTATPSPGAPPPPPPPPPPLGCSGAPNISSFTGSPMTITAGGSSTLSWGLVSNADSVEIDQGIGGVATPGSRVVAPGSTTTYTLTARCGSNTRTARVTITVTVPAPAFAVTGVTASVNPSTYTGTCPGTFNFFADITANGAGTVTFRWEWSDGGVGATQSVTFGVAGSQRVTTPSPMVLSAPASMWGRVHILTPNDRLSNQASFTNSCGAAFAVTNVTIEVSRPGTYTGACPEIVVFFTTITANGPGTATYQWEYSDGGVYGPFNLTFTGPGYAWTITSDAWELSANGSFWGRVHVLTPNDRLSNQASFTNNCH